MGHSRFIFILHSRVDPLRLIGILSAIVPAAIAAIKVKALLCAFAVDVEPRLALKCLEVVLDLPAKEILAFLGFDLRDALLFRRHVIPPPMQYPPCPA